MLWFKKKEKKEDVKKEESKWIIHPKESWEETLRELKSIKHTYDSRVCVERGMLYWGFDDLWERFYNRDEKWFYDEIKYIINQIGDGWCNDFERIEYVYVTPDGVISSYDDRYSVEELENGDLLVKKTENVKKTKTKNIDETIGARYDVGTWKKETITTTYSKKMISDEDILKLKKANLFFCVPYEAMQLRDLEFK